MYRLVAVAARFILPCFLRIHVTGKEHMPQEGGVVLACNHVSWLDVLFLAFAALPRPVHYMAKKELFARKGVAWLLRSLHAFPVDRERPGPSVLKIPLTMLQNGKVVGIFPSGTRTSEDTTLKQGAVSFALRAHAPLIAAVYQWPGLFLFSYMVRRPFVSLQFWPALHIGQSGDRKQEQAMAIQQLSERLRGQLAPDSSGIFISPDKKGKNP